MGNEQSASENQRTSSAPSPESLQPPGNSRSTKRKPEEQPRSAGGGDAPSVAHGAACTASEGAAGLDPGIAYLEVTELRKHPQKAGGPAGSPPPSPPAPREPESTPSSMPGAEEPPEAYSVGPPAAPEDWPLVQPLAQRPGRQPSLGAQGDALAALAPPGGRPAQRTVAASGPPAGGEGALKEEGPESASFASRDQAPGLSPAPPRGRMEAALGGEAGRPRGVQSEREEAAGDLALPASGRGAASVQAPPTSPPAAPSGQGSPAGLEQCPPRPEPPSPQEPAPSAPGGGSCSAERPRQDFVADLGACRPTGSISGAAPQESRQDPPPPALGPGAGGSGTETVDASDAQCPSKTRVPGAKPSDAVGMAAGGPPEGPLLMGTQEPCPAAPPAAQAPVAAEEPDWLARETVSSPEAPTLTDSARQEPPSDLRGEGGGPARAPQESGKPWGTEPSHEVQQGVPPPPPSTSDEGASQSPGPQDEAQAPDGRGRAERGSRPRGAGPGGEEQGPEPPGGAEPGDLGGQQPQALGRRPDPETDKEEASQVTSDGGQRGAGDLLLPGHDQQDSPARPGRPGPAAAPPGPPGTPLQPGRPGPDAAASEVPGEQARPCEREREASPRAPGPVDAPQVHAPRAPREDASLPTRGGEGPASTSERQRGLPEGRLPGAPSSGPGDSEPESPVMGRSELPALGGPGPEAAGGASQPTGALLPAAEPPQASPRAGGLGIEESRAGQGPPGSQQEPGAPEAGGQRGASCPGDAGESEAAEARPPGQGVGTTQGASGNTAGAPPHGPDSGAPAGAARCLPAPAPASPGLTATGGAPEREAGGEPREGASQPEPAPWEEMDAVAPDRLGRRPPAEERGVEGTAARAADDAGRGDLGVQQPPDQPRGGALSSGIRQPEQRPCPGEQAPAPAPGEAGHTELPSASTVDTPAAQVGTPTAQVDTPAAQVDTPAAQVDTISASTVGTPTAQVDTPTAQVDTPAVQVDTPAAQVGTPTAQVDTPAAQVDTPTAQVDTPAAQVDTPAAQVDTPAAQVGTPTAQVDTPAAQVDTPTAQVDTPTAQVDTPTAQVDTPTAQVDTPTAQVGTPAAQVDTPAAQVGTPAAQVGTPAAQVDTPAAQVGTPTAQVDTPAAQVDTPTAQVGTPAAQVGTPAAQVGTPAAQVGTPTAQVGTPAVQVGTPAAQVDTPAAQVGTPTAQVDTPAAQVGTPAAQVDTPAAQVGTPTAQVGTPAAQVDTPAAQVGTPAAQVDTPAAQVDTPTAQVDTPEAQVGTPEARAVPDPERLLPSGPPALAALDTPYLHIDGAPRKGAEDGPRGEGPGPLAEPPFASGNATSASGTLAAGHLASLSQPGAACGDVPVAGASEGPEDPVPYLDSTPLPATGEQVTGEEAAPGAGPRAPKVPASPGSERGSERSGDRTGEPPQDPGRGALGGVDASPKQSSPTAGFPDFREHITKIFETSVRGALADRPQRAPAPGEKAGAPRSVGGKDLDGPLSPGKLPDGTPAVAAAPVLAPPTGLRVDAEKQEPAVAVEAEASHPVPQDPAPEQLPRGAGLGQGGQTHARSPKGSGPQEAASGPSLPEAPVEKAAGAQAARSHREADSVPDNRIPSGEQHRGACASRQPPQAEGAGGPAPPGAPGDVPASTSALGAPSPRGDALTGAKAAPEPGPPGTLPGEGHGGAAGISEAQKAPGPAAAGDTPPGPGLAAGGAREAEGDVALSTAETGARAPGDAPGAGAMKMPSAVAAARGPPGDHGGPGSSEGPQQPAPELPTPPAARKADVASPPEPEEAGDPRLAPEASREERSSDSEEAFETPESTTPVKAPPAPPPPPPEVVPEPEVSAPPSPEEPGVRM
ncbi:transforming acidic coiled-coil-containing protein 2 isoform X4 [Myotis yumanensis]|uniref:transforming acidic coiled-coil-containing protein 2 isoform X4 n=1 Tax=Myotis yumanensis TaxID=159337 RepID=UPI0038D5035D